MTDELYEKILKAIKKCRWKNSKMGVDVCRGAILPCREVIDLGKCPIIKDLMASNATPESEDA